jgi:nucleotide-binding universal stress UspA family protein
MSGKPGHSVIVVGLDGTDASSRALHYAFGLAHRQGSAILAVHVMPPLAAVDASLIRAMADTSLEITDVMRAMVEALAKEYGQSARFVRTEGNPARRLIRIAEQERADGIVVGAGKRGVHKLLSSTALQTVRYSPCPVTVVP